MTRNQYALVLRSIRRNNPVSAEGVARQYSIDEQKHTVCQHIAGNKAVRLAARRKVIA